MTMQQMTDLLDLIKTYLPKCTIPVEPQEMEKWNNELTRNYDIYATAIKVMFRNMEVEKNQKYIRSMKDMPLPTIRAIGEEFYKNTEEARQVNLRAISQQVMLLREGYDHHFMTVKKRDEHNQVFYEDVVDSNGHIIYIKIDEKYYKDQKEKNKHKEYWDKKELLEHSKIVSEEEARRF